MRSNFQNALSLYFIKLVAPTTAQLQPILAPKLVISSTNNKGTTTIIPIHTCYQKIKLVKDKEDAIKELIEKISTITITQSLEKSFDEHKSELPDEELKKMTVGGIIEMYEKNIF